MPPKTTIAKKKKRSSVTDTMFSPAEKILSGVTRQLIVILDSDSDSAELNKYWKSAPRPCIVVVPGPKGASKYIYHIRDRLKHEGFRFDGGAKLWYRPKLPNQKTLQEQADWITSVVARMWD